MCHIKSKRGNVLLFLEDYSGDSIAINIGIGTATQQKHTDGQAADVYKIRRSRHTIVGQIIYLVIL